ncbi:MAG TPA: hypothetical protein VHW00_09475 [Thermoanaerobaculia bacterium]|nr:hypothetical protein [Thermoanaerobaculia bacterium]
MRVVVRLAAIVPKSNDAEASEEPLSELRRIVRLAAETELRPMASQGALRHYFWFDVPDHLAASVVDRVRRLNGVEAAYVKPPDESP